LAELEVLRYLPSFPYWTTRTNWRVILSYVRRDHTQRRCGSLLSTLLLFTPFVLYSALCHG